METFFLDQQVLLQLICYLEMGADPTFPISPLLEKLSFLHEIQIIALKLSESWIIIPYKTLDQVILK